MQKRLLLLLAAGLGFGNTQSATAISHVAGFARTAGCPAPAAMQLDLTRYGVPLLLQVPEGTRAVRSLYGNVEVNGPNFALTISEMGNSVYTPQKSVEQHKAYISSGYKTVVDEPLVFRALSESEDSDESFVVAVNNPGAQKHYLITKGEKSDHSYTAFGAAATTVMYEAAHSARLTPAALAAKPQEEYAEAEPIAIERNAAGEVDLSDYSMPVLVKVPAGTTMKLLSLGGVALNGPAYSVRVQGEEAKAAERIAKIASNRKSVRDAGYVVAVVEPTSALGKSKSGELFWIVTLPDATHGKVYSLEYYPSYDKRSTTVQCQAMYASAKTAHVKK